MTTPAGGWLGVGRAVAGFVLGAFMTVFLPPLALAMGLVVAGVLVWARVRHLDAGPLTGLGGGFVLAVVAAVLLTVVTSW